MLMLIMHLGAAAILWRFLPHGFSVRNLHFWCNAFAPLIVIAVCAVGCAALLKNWVRLALCVMTAGAVAYLAAAAAWIACFPISGKSPAMAALLLVCCWF